jgi:transposase
MCYTIILPVIARYFGNNDYMFQDENAPVYRAGLVKYYSTENDVTTTPWPAYSPDLDIIEKFWLHIKRRLYTAYVTYIRANS